jgi:hypothetical protein
MTHVKDAWALCQAYGCQAFNKDAELVDTLEIIGELRAEIAQLKEENERLLSCMSRGES